MLYKGIGLHCGCLNLFAVVFQVGHNGEPCRRGLQTGKALQLRRRHWGQRVHGVLEYRMQDKDISCRILPIYIISFNNTFTDKFLSFNG